jgi:hypothetical protein
MCGYHAAKSALRRVFGRKIVLDEVPALGAAPAPKALRA